ncbi:putative ubiquitin-conjugating enzyme E2 [Megavirus courdo11]|uniref:E2 ubiquitin-conjugating enzyme n=1 Tax=Megavirus courdo11 TaxID=1128140 RepID=K7YHC5_9VIRU|nr:putative ubiquitin-conjugating enzyme E2 [Megavirus courdo11]
MYSNKHNLKNNSAKSMSDSIIMDEINKWKSKNTDNDIKVKSIDSNKIILSFTHGQEHLVEINYPKGYPNIKKGFSCREITSGSSRLNFISKADAQLQTKNNLSIIRIINHLVSTFDKYKKTKVKHVDKINSIVFGDQPNDEMWFVNDNKNNDNKSVNQNNSITNPVKNQAIVNTRDVDINRDIDIINKILETREQNHHQNRSMEYNNADINKLIVQKTLEELNLSDKIFKPVDESKSVDQSKYVDESKSVDQSKSIDQSKYVDESKSIDQSKYVDESNQQEEIYTLDSSKVVRRRSRPVRNISKKSNSISPHSTEVIKPVSNEVIEPISNEVIKPVSNEVIKPVYTEVIEPVINEVIEPISNEVIKPVYTEVIEQVINEVIEPISNEVIKPVYTEVIEQVINEVIEPISNEVIEPVINEVIEPVYTEVIEPVINDVIEPISNEVIEPVINEVIEPVSNEVIEPVINEVIEPVITEVIEPVINEVIEPVSNEVIEPVSNEVIEPVINEVIEPVINKVIEPVYNKDIKPVVNEIIESISKVIEPVNENIITKIKSKKAESKTQFSSIMNENKPVTYKLFLSKRIKEIRKNNPSMKHTECFSKAAKDWTTFKTNKLNNSVDKKIKTNKLNNSVDKKIKTTNKSKKCTTMSFEDVDDKMGIYLNLRKYIQKDDYPYDMKKLEENALKTQHQNSYESSNSDKIYKNAIKIIINEFKKLYHIGLRYGFKLEPNNLNIYDINLLLCPDFFNKNTKIYTDMILNNISNIKLNIKFDSQTYPFYPPKIKIISPILKNGVAMKIASLDNLLPSKWNSCVKLEDIITEIKQICENYGEIDNSTDIQEYDELYNELIDLAILFNSSNNLITNESENKKTPQKWKSGTGFGHDGQKDWDFKSVQFHKQNNENNLMKCLKNIVKRLSKIILNNIKIDAVSIIKNSCFMPYLRQVFSENTIMDLLKNITHFELLLNSIRIMTPEYIPLFTDMTDGSSLNDILREFYKDCKKYLKTIKKAVKSNSEEDQECNLVSNFIDYYKKLQTRIKKYKIESTESFEKITDNNKIDDDKSNNDVKYYYKSELTNESCRECSELQIAKFEDLAQKDKINNISVPSLKRISKELLLHSKNLPIEYESSIFHRYLENNLKCHEFIITGPESTPYDSGCFHFRMYCTSEYPNKSPKVIICNTGKGKVRFNPNLYKCGKVCLSILGTWPGRASETWLPGQSTMMQIMISIQSLVLIPDPYFNEPGYENSIGKEKGIQQSTQYNEKVRLDCMKWAMIDIIKNPIPGFENVIKKHFTIKTPYIKQICEKWVNESSDKNKKEYETLYQELCQLLNALH